MVEKMAKFEHSQIRLLAHLIEMNILVKRLWGVKDSIVYRGFNIEQVERVDTVGHFKGLLYILKLGKGRRIPAHTYHSEFLAFPRKAPDIL